MNEIIRSGSATQRVAESGKIMYPWLIEPVINVVVGDKNFTEEDEDAVNAVHYMVEHGQLRATSVPQKYPYGNGKFLLYMESGASIEKLEAAYALLAQVYIKEKESHSTHNADDSGAKVPNAGIPPVSPQ